MGCFNRKIMVTVNDYNISLSREIKFFQNDTIELCFSIFEYETQQTEGNTYTHGLAQVMPLKAYMLLESPEGNDYVEATSIENNEVVFKLTSKHSNFVGIGRMQIVLKDSNGCRVTLPSFNFEIRENINPYWSDIDEPIIPEEPDNPDIPIEETLYMYYGRINVQEAGGKWIQYNEITEDMIKTAVAVTKAEASTLDKTSLGLMSATKPMDYLIVAVPKSKNYKVTKDNGIGGKVKWNEDISGSNGIDIIIDEKEYLLYGEVLLCQGQIFIYID